MKFVNIITLHAHNSLELISNELSELKRDELQSLYKTFNNLEYTLENGYVGMFAIIDETTLSILLTEYVKIGINFSVIDLTKEIFFGCMPIISETDKQRDLTQLIKDFITDNLNLDIVLDKISKKGIHSLSKHDKLILSTK